MEKLDYNGQLDKLKLLQQLDAEIYNLRSRKDSFPQKIEELNNSLDDKTGAMNAAEKELKDLQIAQGEKENEMVSNEEKVKKYESDLFQIKNNKEYKALQGEIGIIKADISVLEEDIINLLDKIDDAKNKYEQEKKLFEEEKQKVNVEQEGIKKEEKEIDVRLGELGSEREGFTQDIDKGILSKYEKILANRGGTALAKVNGEFCGACHMTLRPQAINEARLKKDPVFCENCSRILYAEEEGS